ncbi:MAG: phage portal protein, partial [Anaerostipes sp.]|nr:phage portal protein [Anaerostipes sp.]
MYRLSAEKELTDEKLSYFINQHNADISNRLRKLADAYKTKFQILYGPEKPPWKPDNRIAVNFPKYIVDTMNGFILGNPVKISIDEGASGIPEYVEMFEQYNNIDDHNAELSKICSIFGRGYELLYVDEYSQICTTHVSPMEGFMIFDDSVLERPRYFVRIYKDEDEIIHGTVSDDTLVRYFSIKGKFEWEDERLHGFDGVPAIEYVENEEKMGIFEPVLTMIDAYNKAISEKANDVDYFADAYLKVLGAYLDEDDTKHMRDNRIINFDETMASGTLPEVDFLSKPNGDTTQENLINRLEKLIFQISMVANINDEN